MKHDTDKNKPLEFSAQRILLENFVSGEDQVILNLLMRGIQPSVLHHLVASGCIEYTDLDNQINLMALRIARITKKGYDQLERFSNGIV